MKSYGFKNGDTLFAKTSKKVIDDPNVDRQEAVSLMTDEAIEFKSSEQKLGDLIVNVNSVRVRNETVT